MSYSEEIIKITEDIYCIREVRLVNQYVVIGRDKALLFDTGYGFTDIRKEIVKITDKPLIVVNSHGDIDHAGGNFRFDEVYLSVYDYKTLKEIDDRNRRMEQFDYRAGKQGSELLADMKAENMSREDYEKFSAYDTTYHLMDDGYLFDLGDVKLEVIAIPGHTAGSVALLDRTHRILFSGDSIMEHTVYMVPGREREPLGVFYWSLKKLKKYKSEFDGIYPGHGRWGISAETVDDMLCNLEEIHDLKGEHRYFGESDNQKQYIHSYKKTSILYDMESQWEFAHHFVVESGGV